MIRFPGLDDRQSVFLNQELTTFRKTIIKKRPGLKLLTKFPISMNSPVGAETIKVPILDFTGVAKVIARNSTTIPKADVTLDEVNADVHEVANYFETYLREIENASFAGRPLAQNRMQAALRSMEQGLNNVLLYGDPDNNLLGLLSETSYFNKFANPSGAPWTNASDPADIFADMAYLVMYSFANSEGVEMTKRVLMGTQYWTILTTKRAGTLDNKKLIAEIRETWPDVDFDYVPQLNSVTNPRTGSGSVPVIIAFDHKDPEAAAFEIPLMNQMLPPERKGLAFETIVRSLTAGILSSRPKSISIMDFPAA